MSAPLTIGVVCYASLGGSGVVATALATGLAERGHRMHVIASAPPSRALATSERLALHVVPVTNHPVLGHPLYGLALAETIVDVARRHALDLLHVHYAVPHAASALLACQTLGAAAPRIVTSMHGSDVTGFGVAQSYAEVTRYAVAASDGLTVPSEFLRREAEARFGLGEAAPIAVLPNFVDTERFAPVARRDRGRFARFFLAPPNGGFVAPPNGGFVAPPNGGFVAPDASLGASPDTADGPILLHVSNFRAVKRVPDLIEVLARVRRTLRARLVLVGDGPERAAAEVRARELGVAAHVAFLGPRADFADYLPHADVFVLPSATESFGVAALEAMSAGVPVCAYRVGGLPEVVGDAGVLVEPFACDALADAVLAVVGDENRRTMLGAAARARVVASFGHAAALDRWETYLREVTVRGKTASP